jgi:hypothetical protein
MSDSEGENLKFSFLYYISLAWYWLDIAGDHGMYNYYMNKYNNLLYFNLDILMASPPQTPPRKRGSQFRSEC